MSRKLFLILFVTTIALALAACGNKGPLILPDKPQEQQDKDKKKDVPTNTAQPAAKAGDAAQH